MLPNWFAGLDLASPKLREGNVLLFPEMKIKTCLPTGKLDLTAFILKELDCTGIKISMKRLC